MQRLQRLGSTGACGLAVQPSRTAYAAPLTSGAAPGVVAPRTFGAAAAPAGGRPAVAARAAATGMRSLPGLPRLPTGGLAGLAELSIDADPELSSLELRNVKVRRRGRCCAASAGRIPDGTLGAGCLRRGKPSWPAIYPAKQLTYAATRAQAPPHPPPPPPPPRSTPSTTPRNHPSLPRTLACSHLSLPQEVSYVSRRRMDDADFDPEEVDDDGLPLVYNEESISAYWKDRPGELTSRWTMFAGISGGGRWCAAVWGSRACC